MRIINQNILKMIFNIYLKKYKFIIILFKFINILIIFQIIMNNLFRLFLNKFYIVYFDDILIYLNILENYAKYLKIVLFKLKKYELYIKLNKYEIKIKSMKFYNY